jgi:Arc/MetJ-type ribon-helix-helix transcriptional regulator
MTAPRSKDPYFEAIMGDFVAKTEAKWSRVSPLVSPWDQTGTVGHFHTRQYGIFGSMKSKTSITLSQDVLEDLDRLIGRSGNRSRVIESAVREYIRQHLREARDRRDLELINAHAASLNKETKEALSYQIKL